MRIYIAVLAMVLSSSVILADGAELYRQCVSCHGTKAEISPGGTGRVINQMSSYQIEQVLKNSRGETSSERLKHVLDGFREGNRSEYRRLLMQSHTFKLNNKDIKELALHIPTLK